MKRKIALMALVILTWATSGTNVEAGVASKALREAAELLIRKGGKEVAGETAESLAGKMATMAARHGDDVVAKAFTRVGPRAATIVREAGEHSGTALRLLGKHGDDAIRVVARPKALNLIAKYGDEVTEPLIRHGEIGESLLEKFGAEGAEALGKLSPQNVRRLAMLVEEQGEKVTPGLVKVFAKNSHADTLADFVWRNKGSLFVGGTLATFIAKPEPFLQTGESVAVTALDSAVQPVAREAASHIPWGFMSLVGFILAVGLMTYRVAGPIVLTHGAKAAVHAAVDAKKQFDSRFTPTCKENSRHESEIR